MPTISEVTNVLAAVVGDRDGTHRSIRNFVAKRLIPTESSGDGRGTLLVSASEIYRIRLYLALTAAGLEHDDFRDGSALARAINPPADGVMVERDASGQQIEVPFWKDPERQKRNLAAVIASKDYWLLPVVTMRDVKGRRVVGAAGFILETESAEYLEAHREAAAFREFQALTVEALTFVPVSRLFRQLEG